MPSLLDIVLIDAKSICPQHDVINFMAHISDSELEVQSYRKGRFNPFNVDLSGQLRISPDVRKSSVNRGWIIPETDYENGAMYRCFEFARRENPRKSNLLALRIERAVELRWSHGKRLFNQEELANYGGFDESALTEVAFLLLRSICWDMMILSFKSGRGHICESVVIALMAM